MAAPSMEARGWKITVTALPLCAMDRTPALSDALSGDPCQYLDYAMIGLVTGKVRVESAA